MPNQRGHLQDRRDENQRRLRHSALIWFILVGLAAPRDATAGDAKPRKLLPAAKADKFSWGAFSPNGKTMALLPISDGVKVRDMAAGKIVHHLEPGVHVASAVFSPDGRLLATANVKAIKLWDVHSGKQTGVVTGLASPTGLGAAFRPLAFTADSASLLVVQHRELLRVSCSTAKVNEVLWKSEYLGLGSHFVLSPDGQTFAVSSGDEICIFALLTGKKAASFKMEDAGLFIPVFSGDGKTLACCGKNRISVWDAASAETKAIIQDKDALFSEVVLTHDGQTLLCRTYDGFERRSVATGKLVEGPEIAVNERRFVGMSPDGKLLATLSTDDLLRLWDPVSGKELAGATGHVNAVLSIAFSPDGKTLASSNFGAILLWDAAEGKIKRALFPRRGAFTLAYSPDGRSLVCGGGGWLSFSRTAQLWDVESGALKLAFEDFGHEVASVAFSHDGKTLALGGYPPLEKTLEKDARITFWDPVTGKQKSRVDWLKCWQVSMVAFSRDDKTLAAGTAFLNPGFRMRLWDLKTGKTSTEAAGVGPYQAVAFPPGNATVLALAGNRLDLLDIATGKAKKSTKLEGLHLFTGAAFSSDCRLVAAGDEDKSVKVFDTDTGALLAVFRGEDSKAPCVAFSPDGTLLAVGYANGAIRIWDVPKRP